MKRLLCVSLCLACGWLALWALSGIAQEDDPLGGMRDGDGRGGGGPEDNTGTYTIVPGDWLSKISQRFYGTPYLWPRIYEANRDRLGPNPDLIYPGVTLRIPPADGVIRPPDPGQMPGGGTAGGGKPGNGPYNQTRPLEHGTVTSNFGPRSLNGRSYHYGLDIGVPNGTRVMASGPGRVVHAGPMGGYGNLVKVAHADGTVTYYAHLMRATVRVGDTVAPGQQIALSNNTGDSTGPHLHFSVEKNGRFQDPRQSFNFPAVGGRF